VADQWQPVPTPVMESLAAWAAWPDVLADYHQHGERGVWTFTDDVLPDRAVPTGRPVTAAWGEMTWGAVVGNSSEEPGLVWLTPVTEPAEVPDPLRTYDLDRLVRAVLDDLAADVLLGADRGQLEAALQIALRRRVAGLLADLQATTNLFVREIRRDRSAARGLLAELAELPEPEGRRLLHSPAGRLLYRLARRTRPPRRRGAA
jgi:hypothetical protein